MLVKDNNKVEGYNVHRTFKLISSRSPQSAEEWKFILIDEYPGILMFTLSRFTYKSCLILSLFNCLLLQFNPSKLSLFSSIFFCNFCLSPVPKCRLWYEHPSDLSAALRFIYFSFYGNLALLDNALGYC